MFSPISIPKIRVPIRIWGFSLCFNFFVVDCLVFMLSYEGFGRIQVGEIMNFSWVMAAKIWLCMWLFWIFFLELQVQIKAISHILLYMNSFIFIVSKLYLILLIFPKAFEGQPAMIKPKKAVVNYAALEEAARSRPLDVGPEGFALFTATPEFGRLLLKLFVCCFFLLLRKYQLDDIVLPEELPRGWWCKPV